MNDKDIRSGISANWMAYIRITQLEGNCNVFTVQFIVQIVDSQQARRINLADFRRWKRSQFLLCRVLLIDSRWYGIYAIRTFLYSNARRRVDKSSSVNHLLRNTTGYRPSTVLGLKNQFRITSGVKWTNFSRFHFLSFKETLAFEPCNLQTGITSTCLN